MMQAEPMAQPIQIQAVGQTRVVPAQTNQPHNRYTCVVVTEIIEIIIRVICSLCNLGTLIAASIAVEAINEVAEFLNENGAEYENVGCYRAAAGWLIFVASSAIIFHVIAVIIFVLLYSSSTVTKHTKLLIYMVVNIIICVLFAIAFLAGGIVNIDYASDNDTLHFNLCFGIGTFDDEFCDQLQRVIDAEHASGVSSFVSMAFFSSLVFITVCSCIKIASTSSRYSMQPQVRPTLHMTDMSAYPPPSTSQHVPPPRSSYPYANTSQYPLPSAPPYPPGNMSQHASPSAPYYSTTHRPSMLPSAPLEREDDAPPSYESAVASRYTVPQPAPSCRQTSGRMQYGPSSIT